MKAALKPDKLRRSYDEQNLKLTTTADIDGETKIIGQPRGVQAIAFGIKMNSRGYNIYVLGESGTGRTTAIQQFVEEQAEQRSGPFRLDLRQQLPGAPQTAGYPVAGR